MAIAIRNPSLIWRPSLAYVGVAAVTAIAGLVSGVAADAPWLVALGRAIVNARAIPDGVPFATTTTHGWPNVPVLGELIFAGLHGALGDRGLQLAQMTACGLAFWLLARDAIAAKAGDRATFACLIAAAFAILTTLVTIRAQLFSLPLFALLVLLLRADARAPSRRIWLVPAVLALWMNVHGAALTGAAVAVSYCIFSRLRAARRRETLGVLLALPLALCANPALWRTPVYVLGVMQNAAAEARVGLWGQLSLSHTLDVITIAVAAALLVAAVRTRPDLWEIIACLGLIGLTVQTSRGALWLVLFVLPRAAVGLRGPQLARPKLAAPFLIALLAVALGGLARGPIEIGATATMVTRAVNAAAGDPILAEDALAEQVAAAGGFVVIGNPIDAFPKASQRQYLDWLGGKPAGDALLAAANVALVRPTGLAAKRLSRDREFRRVSKDVRGALFVRIR